MPAAALILDSAAFISAVGMRTSAIIALAILIIPRFRAASTQGPGDIGRSIGRVQIQAAVLKVIIPVKAPAPTRETGIGRSGVRAGLNLDRIRIHIVVRKLEHDLRAGRAGHRRDHSRRDHRFAHRRANLGHAVAVAMARKIHGHAVREAHDIGIAVAEFILVEKIRPAVRVRDRRLIVVNDRCNL